MSSTNDHDVNKEDAWLYLSRVKPLAAVVQMTSTSDKESNLEQISALIERARKRKADIVFLPECCDFIGDSTDQSRSLAETVEGSFVERLRGLSKKFNMWLSFAFHERVPETESSGRLRNTHIVIDSLGNICSTYNKIHLFDVELPGGQSMKESHYTEPGNRVCAPVETPIGKLGLCVCYDLRFPEMTSYLRRMGAEVLAYPSAFTVPTGMAHWQVLLRSRAIETQCYVVAPAQVGKHNSKRSSYGHAMIIDPWGTVLAECQANRPDVCFAEIDLELVSKVRTDIPVFDHRRSDLYGSPLSQFSCVEIEEKEFYAFGEHQIKSSTVFHRSIHSFAFVNLSPVIPGHILVASLRKVERLKDLTSHEIADIFESVRFLACVVEKLYDAQSATVSVQDGEQAGQTVKHVHVHVLPRKPGDFEANDDVYEKLEKHDKMPKMRRSLQAMEEEAKLIRKAIEDEKKK